MDEGTAYKSLRLAPYAAQVATDSDAPCCIEPRPRTLA
jgi:hypothetical protein